jgi:hypothetical protein
MNLRLLLFKDMMVGVQETIKLLGMAEVQCILVKVVVGSLPMAVASRVPMLALQLWLKLLMKHRLEFTDMLLEQITQPLFQIQVELDSQRTLTSLAGAENPPILSICNLRLIGITQANETRSGYYR